LTVPVTFGDVLIGPIALSLNWQLLGLATFVVGLQAFFLGGVAQVLFDFVGRKRRRWLAAFPYTRTVLIAALLVLAGLGLGIPLVARYVGQGYSLTPANRLEDHLAVTGLAVGIAGAQLFVFVLLLHGAVLATARGRSR
jgi:hypothetical protein